jgi:flagella basal body P-ring formation protein FlgA
MMDGSQMLGKLTTAILCAAVVAGVLISSGSQPNVKNKRHIETVSLNSPALQGKLAENSKPRSSDSCSSRFYLDLPPNSKSEFDLQSFDGRIDIIGLVAFHSANGNQLLVPRKFLSNVRLCSISDEEERYRQRGYGIEPLVVRNKKWELSLSGDKADIERFEVEKKWIRGACWVSNTISNDVPSFDISEPSLITTRKVWIAKRNLYQWQRLSKNDVYLEDRNIAELPSDPAFVDMVSLQSSLQWHSEIKSNAVVRAYQLRFPCDEIPNVNFQTGPLGRSVINVAIDFERTRFNISPMPRKWDVVGEFYNSPMRLIQGAKAKRVVARNVSIFTAPLPYCHHSRCDDESTTLIGILVNDIEKSKYVAARRVQSGNFWLVPAGSTSHADLFKDPLGLDEHVRQIHSSRSSYIMSKEVLVANRDLQVGDKLNAYNLYVCDVPETFATGSIAKVKEANSVYGLKVTRVVFAGEILNPKQFE